MKKTGILEAFKKGLKEIPSCLFTFIKKLFANAWVYAYSCVIPVAIAFVVMLLVKTISGNADAASLVFKILATIGQIIPLSMSLYISEWELIDTNENSAEICFTICALVIAALWIKF